MAKCSGLLSVSLIFQVLSHLNVPQKDATEDSQSVQTWTITFVNFTPRNVLIIVTFAANHFWLDPFSISIDWFIAMSAVMVVTHVKNAFIVQMHWKITNVFTAVKNRMLVARVLKHSGKKVIETNISALDIKKTWTNQSNPSVIIFEILKKWPLIHTFWNM